MEKAYVIWLILLIYIGVTLAAAPAQKQKPDLCPDDWVLAKESCLGVFRTRSNWTEAQRICRSHRAQLLTLDTKIKKKNWEDIYNAPIKDFSVGGWTSAHIQADYQYLVWDDLMPHRVTADKDGYHIKGPSEGNHFWKWNSSHPVSGECVLMEQNTPISEGADFPMPVLQLVDCTDLNQFICTRDAVLPDLKVNAAGCPANWYSNSELNKCFSFDRQEKTSVESETHCNGLDATMVDPGSLMEIRMIQSFLPTIGRVAYVWVKPTNTEIQQDFYGRPQRQLQKESEPSACYAVGIAEYDLQSSCTMDASTICQVDKVYGETTATLTSKQKSFVESKDVEKLIRASITCQVTNRVEKREPVFTKDWLPINMDTFHPPIRGMVQGCYRCKVWKPEPFELLTSNSVCIYIKDILTYRGELDVQIPITPKDQTLFNILRQLSGNVASLTKYIEHVITGGFKELRFARKEIKNNDIKVDIRKLISKTDAETITVKFDIYVSVQGTKKTYHSDMSIYQQLNKHVLRQITLLQQPLRDPAALGEVITAKELLTRINPVQGSFKLKSTAYCFATTLSVVDTPVMNFPLAALGDWVNSTETCKGKLEGETSPKAKAVCAGSFEEGTYLEMESNTINRNCVEAEPNYGESYLTYLSEVPVTKNNIQRISKKVAEITMNMANLSPSDLNRVSNVLENIAAFDDIDVQIGNDFCQTVSNIMDVKQTVLNQANTDVPASILHSLDQYTNNVQLGKTPEYEHNFKNLAVRLFDFKSDTQPDSLATGIQLLSANEGHVDDEDDDDNRWSQGITVLRGGTTPANDAEVCLSVPLELLKSQIGSGDKTRLSFMIQQDTDLYRSGNVNKSADEQLTLNSRVISASLGEKRIQNLSNRVSMIFQPLQTENITKDMKVSCVFWDYSLNDHNGGWSDEGCKLDKTDDSGRYVCSCDHLTNFAVLMDLTGTAHLEEVLEIITYVGLSLSIVGLVLTIGSFILFKKIRKGRPQRTLLNLAIALLCTYIVFLAGINKIENDAGCIAVAVLLHYFLLVAFMWMLMEALLQYLRFVKVLGTYIEKFTLKTCLVAWSVPLIPVIILLAIDHRLYRGHETYCFMTLAASYYAVILPIALILLINFIVFALVLWSILRRSHGLQTNQSQKKITFINVYAGIACALLLGLSWIFAFMAVDKAATVFRVIFTVLNTLHGFFIFLFFTLREKVVRDCWRELLCSKKKDKGSTFVAYSHTRSKASGSYDTSSSSNDARRSSDTQTSSSAIISSDPGKEEVRKRNSSGTGSTVMFNNGLAILPAEEEAKVFHNKSYA